MVDPGAKEDYKQALMRYAQANEILDLARCHRNAAVLALIESDLTLTRAIELALKDDEFYERLSALVLEYTNGGSNKAA